MSSLVTNLNSLTVIGSTARKIVSCRLRCGQICSSDSSKLSPTSCEFRTHRRRDSTRQLSRVCVDGEYWALHAGNYNFHFNHRRRYYCCRFAWWTRSRWIWTVPTVSIVEVFARCAASSLYSIIACSPYTGPCPMMVTSPAKWLDLTHWPGVTGHLLL